MNYIPIYVQIKYVTLSLYFSPDDEMRNNLNMFSSNTRHQRLNRTFCMCHPAFASLIFLDYVSPIFIVSYVGNWVNSMYH